MHTSPCACTGNGKVPIEVLSLFSKRQGLFVDLQNPALATIIARSDSNGEDLEAFAGAGKIVPRI